MGGGEQVEARLRALEARIAALEASLRDPGRTTASASTPQPASTLNSAAAPPRLVPPVAWELAPSRPEDARPSSEPPVWSSRPSSSASTPGLGWAEIVANLEEQLTGRALAVVGGAALVAAAVFFLSLAFSRGWIGPEGRVIIGLGVATASLVLGGWLLEHRQQVVGRVLVGVGLAIVSLAMFAATRLYGLIPAEVALGATLAAAVAAAAIAVRYDAQIIAVLALVAVLGAPPILGATPNLVTIGYLGSVLVGFAGLALYRSWQWLPSIAFVLSAPQLASWLTGDLAPALGLAVVAGFWALNVVAAGGEEYLRPRNQLRTGAATVLVANAAYLIWAGFTLLDGPYEGARGAFLVLAAVAHFLVGGWFLRREGDRHPFGLLAAGTGVALFAMAAPVQVGGPPVPIAWAAEATVLAWLAARRAHPQIAVAAAVLGLLALLHLVTFEYPWRLAAPVPSAGWPFVNANGLTLAFMVAAGAVAAWLVRTRGAVAVIGALAALAVANAARHELAGPALVGALVGLALGSLALDRLVIDRMTEDERHALALPPGTQRAAMGAAALLGIAVASRLLQVDLPLAGLGGIVPPAVPFGDARALTLMLAVAATAFAGFVYQRRIAIEPPAVVSLVAAGLILAYGSTFEVYADASIVIAAALAALGFLLGRTPGVDDAGRRLATVASGGLVGVATLAALAIVTPPSRLAVSDAIAVHHLPMVSATTATFGALAAALAVGVRVNPRERFAPWAGIAAGVLVVYLLSVEVVDLFQSQVGGSVTVEELAFQAQVALSVLWIVLGTVVFVFGLAKRRLVVRQAGLALLGLASVKVFLLDLASLDVAYRVLSLFALGTLLLLTAWVYARFRPPPTARPDAPESKPGAA